MDNRNPHDSRWYILIGDVHTGPFNQDEILGLLQDGEILGTNRVFSAPDDPRSLSVNEWVNQAREKTEIAPPAFRIDSELLHADAVESPPKKSGTGSFFIPPKRPAKLEKTGEIHPPPLIESSPPIFLAPPPPPFSHHEPPKRDAISELFDTLQTAKEKKSKEHEDKKKDLSVQENIGFFQKNPQAKRALIAVAVFSFLGLAIGSVLNYLQVSPQMPKGASLLKTPSNSGPSASKPSISDPRTSGTARAMGGSSPLPSETSSQPVPTLPQRPSTPLQSALPAAPLSPIPLAPRKLPKNREDAITREVLEDEPLNDAELYESRPEPLVPPISGDAPPPPSPNASEEAPTQ